MSVNNYGQKNTIGIQRSADESAPGKKNAFKRGKGAVVVV